MTATDELLPCPFCGGGRMINAEWTNADTLAFKPYTAYESVHVTYSTATTDTISGLLAENAKLRELVRDMNKWLWNGSDPETGDVISAANYCPNCGRRVVAGESS